MEAASITNAPRLGDHQEAPSARGLLSDDFGCASRRMLGPRSVENHETGCGVPGVQRAGTVAPGFSLPWSGTGGTLAARASLSGCEGDDAAEANEGRGQTVRRQIGAHP
jgi:hypothetical protein